MPIGNEGRTGSPPAPNGCRIHRLQKMPWCE